ncbi:MAG: hypothetical protein RIR00_2607 [Pseudomonadota bacterium]|jgi:septum site-determining protein MinC
MAKASALEFKGVSLTLIQVQLRSCALPALHQALADLTGNAADFFADDLAVLDFAGLEAWPESLDWEGMRQLLRSSGLHPVATHGLPAELAASAAAAGLPALAAGALKRPPRPAARPAAEPAPAPAPAPVAAAPAPVATPVAAPVAPAPAAAAPQAAQAPVSATTASPRQGELSFSEASAAATAAASAQEAAARRSPEPAEAPAAPPVLPPADAAIIDKPLRSGQRFYARGRDLVVLAMVSSGAEVIADGNIHVYAPLRGRALAGASGDRSARIFTTCMEAELVSIAGIYRTFENGVPAPLRKASAMVSLGSDPASDALQVKPLSLS